MVKRIAQQTGQPELDLLLKLLQQYKVLKTGRSLDLGEVFPFIALNESRLNDLCPSLVQLVEQCGYMLAGKEAIPPDIVLTKGNIARHSDSDSGLISLTLLHVAPLSGSPSLSLTKGHYEHVSYLWTADTLTPLKTGETIIFNTDQDHAWFCSGIAAFLCVPVREYKAIATGVSGLS